MSPLSTAITQALIHFVWQGSIVVFLLWIALAALKKSSANTRYAVSCAGLALIVLVPIVTTVLSYQTSSSSSWSSNSTSTPLPVVTLSWSGSNTRTVDWLGQLQRWMLPMWSLGVLLFSSRLLWGCSHAIALGRRGEAADDAIVRLLSNLATRMRIRRRVRVLISSLADVPSVVGWLRPIVLLPAASLAGLTPTQLEAVLAHELAHIRRFDYLVNILQLVAETLFFYHPGVWWMSKRIRFERELCCDDDAVRFSGDALTYARALTLLEKMRIGTPTLALGSAHGPLRYRIERIVGVRSQEHRPSRVSAIIAVGFGIACIAINANSLRGQVAGAAPHQEPLEAFSVAIDSPGTRVDLHGSSVIHRSSVQYPKNLIKQGLKGTVSLEIALDSAGLVADAHVLSGPQEFRKTALQSVLDWHFTRDAANSNRQISIGFEPPPPESETRHFFTGRVEADRVLLDGPMTITATTGGDVVYRGWKRDGAEKDPEAIQWFTIETGQRELQDKVETAQRELQDKVKELRAAAEKKDLAGDLDQAALDLERTARVELAEKQVRALHEHLTIGLRGNPAVEGRTLHGIRTPGLSDSVRNELLSRLPVREGDSLAADSIQATMKAVRDFDEHLEVGFVATDETNVEIRIIVGGEGWGGMAIHRLAPEHK